MWRTLISLAVVSIILSSKLAGADPDGVDDTLYTCKKLAAHEQVSVQFAPGATLEVLAVWLSGFTCKTIVFDESLAAHPTKLRVISPAKFTVKQATQLFFDAVELAGLVATVKGETILIKAPPKPPCPGTK
ncbi:MAG TPA: hypothetical protein VFQ53_08125 [Kofleriaceae bacterium]|nr:hypothetical protein [Kofleriaceae bacterium]